MNWFGWILGRPLYHLAERAGDAARCRSFVSELRLLMYKACFRRLPEGKCLQYVIYTKHLTREQLCPLIGPEMLAQMDACTQVSRQELQCKLLSYTIDEKIDMSAAVTMAVSVHFEGRQHDGRQVSVHMDGKRLIASLVVDQTYYWKLMKIAAVDG